ncbi:LysR substrate-binding domain-containing protein [Legionella jordanis]|uniref:Transcriptional regulator n=1 Tax=Legionella jordanis TaxID=456 RepID=A0A0W0V932_9GAMM|nr:LysR substrate-binding domain-containing protein [Legionella jordanis]KTD16657.1 transcriptional regulator [Legionella jordanis]RMX03808.1 LysR family transcriptional regulator [Legionella jordanis]RMX22130.1 LysR family transcriptional regulator [Legionella jordanis]VEH11875.1 hydrogen peroxide-inducible genes activator [Legionella jordanis]HAT8712816.1 LysR family transcriptional regulator [Legionella jordanis]
MNLRDLHYFVTLADAMHFGETAKRCHVSQPTLSMQIKKLEEELGVVLFERQHKQVMLTEAGKALLSRAQGILTEVSEMKELARQFSNPYMGELRLGAIPTVAPYLFPHIMRPVQKAFPKLRVWLVEEKTEQLAEKLAKGQLDAAIMATPVAGYFAHEELFEEPFYFVCAPNAQGGKKQMSVQDLADEHVMLLEEGHCLREQAMAICKMAKGKPRADFTATSLETLRFMVQAGMGVTLLPALSLYGNQQGLEIIPFTSPVPTRSIALFWRPGTAKVNFLESLAALIRSEMKKVLNKNTLLLQT